MSCPDDPQHSAAAMSSSSPSAPTGKAAPAPPKFTQADDGVELKDMESGSGVAKASLPIEEDIMQLARLGEIAAMQKLFDTKKFSAKYKDEEGITALHVCLCSEDLRLLKLRDCFTDDWML
jgi:hypothetical protein